MSTLSTSKDKGRARRLLVTLVITTAAAAVTAGVALKERQSERVVQRAASTAPLAGGIAATPAPLVSRWRDPWKRPAESASTSLQEPGGAAAMGADPSVPTAAQALDSGAGASGEPASTF